jgi:hypothetical protein
MNTISMTRSMLAVAAIVSLTGCATTGISNASGHSVVDLDPSQRGMVAGVGIEAHDVVSMTDQMIRDMLSSPELEGAGIPPQVIVDGEYFAIDGSQRLNKNLITDRLRVGLNRSAQGRMTFVGRHFVQMVAEERDLKRAGVVDIATTGLTQAQAGADYRLGGRMNTLDSLNPSTGLMQRYTQVSFEMVDLERGTIVWSGVYEIERAAADDVVYR